jgi:hypothetical protein
MLYEKTKLPHRIFAISIPLYGCAECRMAGLKAYEGMIKNSGIYDYVYLQNRLDDEYRSYCVETAVEKVL